MNFARYLLNYLFLKDITIITDLLKHKSINNVVIFHCYEPKTVLLVNKIFSKPYIRISANNVQGNNTDLNIQYYFKKVAIVLNGSCEGWINIFNVLDQKNAFKSPFVWLIITENLNQIMDSLSQYRIGVDSDVTVVSKFKDHYDIYETFNTGFTGNGQFIMRKVGLWNKMLHIKYKDRRDLRGLVLMSTVVISRDQKVVNKTFERYLEEAQPDLNTVDALHKSKFFTVLKYFRDMFNVSYELQRTFSWGYHTNGTYDGLVGALQRREADIGGSPIFIRADRAVAVDYAAETWTTRPCFIFRHPKHPGGFYSIYSRPLANHVWYCIVVLIALASVMLAVMLRLRAIQLPNDDADVSPSLAVLFIWSAICQQGVTVNRSSTSVKMVIFVTFLFALTIYQYYNATVVSTLLRESPKNIRTLRDLLKSNLKAGVEDILYNKDYFRRTTDPVAIKLYRKKIAAATPSYFPPNEGMSLVKKGGFAFHIDSAAAYKIMRHTFTERELCEIQEVVMFALNVGVAVAKRSAFKEHVAYGIRKMKEAGILSRILSIWDEARPGCVRTPDSSIFSVSLREFSTALIVLLVGYIVAVTILIVEVFVWKLKKRTVAFRHGKTNSNSKDVR